MGFRPISNFFVLLEWLLKYGRFTRNEFGVSDHPVCGAKVGFAEIFLMPQPPLLTRRGLGGIKLQADFSPRLKLHDTLLKTGSPTGFAVNVSLPSLASKSTTTICPSLTSPLNMAFASAVSTSFWIARFSGRAP
jgi:hypothetical protein